MISNLIHSFFKCLFHLWALREIETISTVVDVYQKVGHIFLEVIVAKRGEELCVHEFLGEIQVFGALIEIQVLFSVEIVDEGALITRVKLFEARIVLVHESAEKLVKYVKEDESDFNSECQIRYSHLLSVDLLENRVVFGPFEIFQS